MITTRQTWRTGVRTSLWPRGAVVAWIVMWPSIEIAAQDRTPDIIERVVAVVNDEAIFLSDLRQRALPFLERIATTEDPAERGPALRALYRELLTLLVNEELIEQTAADLQLRVSREDVNRAIENVQQQNNLSDEQFWDAVRQQGFTVERYRSDVRRQLLRLKVLNTRARGRVNVTDAQVREEYEQQVRRASRRTCYALAVRVFRVADETEGGFESACQEAAAVQETVPVEEFDGTDLGTVCDGAMQPQIEEAVRSLEEGEISPPIQTETGCLLVLMRQRTTAVGDIPSYEDVKDTIYRQMVEQAMARQEQNFVDELRQGAIIDRRL